MRSQPRRVLVVGDANPDLILRGDVVPRFGQSEQIVDESTLVLGGSAGITAHAFARLERPVTILAAVGDDLFGSEVQRLMQDAGIDVSHLIRRPDMPTGLSVVLSRGADRATLTMAGAIPTLRAEDVSQVLDVIPDLAHVHVAALFLQPGLADELASVLVECRERGLTTSIDTNADPAGGWVVHPGIYASLDLLLPNREEVLALDGGPAAGDPVTAAGRLASGPLVVVKDGPRGAFAVDRFGNVTSAAGAPQEAVDTTGAGDTFDAAFIDTWLVTRDVRRSLDRAVAAGAHAVGAVGGTAGQPTRQISLG